MVIREGRDDDGPALVQFFLETPVRAGTEFVLDRSPDFNALLRLRGQFRTFIAFDGSRVSGTVTALWHDSHGPSTLRVGEIVDLRIAAQGRGGPAAARLLAAVRDAFLSTRTDWVVCLIGENNHDATRLVLGRAGFPRFSRLARYASVHFPAWRVPRALARSHVPVRPAGDDDAPTVSALVARLGVHRRFQPVHPFPWPDPSGQHRTWIATGADGRTAGALVTWDGSDVRRIRIVKYSVMDQLLRATLRVAAMTGAATALPAPGGALRLWASRWFGVDGHDAAAARSLVHAAVRDAALAGRHVLQINLAEDDPLLPALPALPHSVYWTSVYGCPVAARDNGPAAGERMCFADLALV